MILTFRGTLTFEIDRSTPARDWLGLKQKIELIRPFLGLFDTFCVYGTQNFKANLIMTFSHRLVEVEVTHDGEVVSN